MGTTSLLVTSVMPVVDQVFSAMLSLFGAVVTAVIAVWVALRFYAYLSGKESSWVTYQVGRLFGELIHENRYQEYSAKQRKRDTNEVFRDRYRRESRTVNPLHAEDEKKLNDFFGKL